jgi:hypothetical protein
MFFHLQPYHHRTLPSPPPVELPIGCCNHTTNNTTLIVFNAPTSIFCFWARLLGKPYKHSTPRWASPRTLCNPSSMTQFAALGAVASTASMASTTIFRTDIVGIVQKSFRVRHAYCSSFTCDLTLSKVVRASSPPPRLLLENRELPPGKCLGNAADFLDSTFGAAWLEWNSKLGIPTDVWALTSTAIQECATCHFVRTFPAHAAHLHPGTGACNDLVDESIDY